VAETTTEIRLMRVEDLPWVLEVAAASPQAPHWPEAVYRKALDPETAPVRLALVADRNGRAAGFAIVSLIPPEAELESIVVAPQSRRQGIGQLLLKAIGAELKQQKVMELFLELRASNLAALELYRSAGFVPTAVRPRYYTDPVEDAVLMKALLK